MYTDWKVKFIHSFMVKHTKCFLCEPDNFFNITGFVGVKYIQNILHAYKSALNVL